MLRPFAALFMVAGVLSTVPDQSRAAEPTRLAVTPPPGFSVRQIPKDGSYSAEYEVESKSDPDFGCQIAFDPTKAMPGEDQARINRAAGGADYAALANASVAPMFDVDHTERFSMQGVSGFAMTGVPKGGAGQVRSVMYLLQTPPGRTVISCASPPARFEGLRPTFERIARGVALPR